MKRAAIPELLDTDAGTPDEVAASLADLRRVNRWFGGVATTRALVQRVAEVLGASSLTLLEVGAGSGHVPGVVARDAQNTGLRVVPTLLDRLPSHFSNPSCNGQRSIAGDALALPFTDSSFDLVSCGLFVHHLAPEQVIQFVDEGLRVCRVALLINDLVRHPLHLALVYAGLPLYRSRLTRHDAPASVRQAYTPEELRELLARTAAAKIEISRHFLFRMGVVVWKQQAHTI
jgi:ubiquinone/menaquinone biosynthesis C-methylase UbiE